MVTTGKSTYKQYVDDTLRDGSLPMSYSNWEKSNTRGNWYNFQRTPRPGYYYDYQDRVKPGTFNSLGYKLKPIPDPPGEPPKGQYWYWFADEQQHRWIHQKPGHFDSSRKYQESPAWETDKKLPERHKGKMTAGVASERSE